MEVLSNLSVCIISNVKVLNNRAGIGAVILIQSGGGKTDDTDVVNVMLF